MMKRRSPPAPPLPGPRSAPAFSSNSAGKISYALSSHESPRSSCRWHSSPMPRLSPMGKMASNFTIQQPHTLVDLPASSNATRRLVAGPVFSQVPRSRKRKRTELSIGIDHDAVNLYHIPASRLVTSYPIPPQSIFTCAPCSLRLKDPQTRDVVRYTYIATEDTQSSRRTLVLFKDVLGATGGTTSTSVAHVYRSPLPIVHLSTASALSSWSSSGGHALSISLLAVMQDGCLAFFSGESLEPAWNSCPTLLGQDLPPTTKSSLKVEHVQQALYSDLVEGGMVGREGMSGFFAHDGRTDEFDPDVFLILSSVSQQSAPDISPHRYLHFLVICPGNETQERGLGNAVQVHAAPLPALLGSSITRPQHHIDARSGTLMSLLEGTLFCYHIQRGICRLDCQFDLPGATSFLRLSKSSVLIATAKSLDVYNPIYRSLQATIPISEKGQDATHGPCELLAYFGKLELGVALRGPSLLLVQMEAPKNRSKRRAQGLLVDSLARGLVREEGFRTRRNRDVGSSVLSRCLPGTISARYWEIWRHETAKADALLDAGDLKGFEELLSATLGVQVQASELKTENEETVRQDQVLGDSRHWTNWQWPASRAETLPVDRRWVLFAIQKVFAWEPDNRTRLSCRLPESNILNLLIDAGHLSTSNLKSAFRDEAASETEAESVFSQELPRLLVRVDPAMELLLHYLAATDLGVVELLMAIRLLMSSFGLLHDTTKALPNLAASGSSQEVLDGDQESINRAFDRVEEGRIMAEFYLGEQSSTRGKALSVAFGKLGRRSALETVQGVRRLYKPDQVLSLITILRTELVRDGWTTRYLDEAGTCAGKEDAPDGSIRIIADLLCRCLDAVGPGGWLGADVLLTNFGHAHEAAEFFKQFKMEVSAALEAIEESVRLKGILAQTIKYGASIQQVKSLDKGKAVSAAAGSAESRMLPFGLKPRSGISMEKVTSGGEIVRRSQREISHLLSRKVGPYSCERIRV